MDFIIIIIIMGHIEDNNGNAFLYSQAFYIIAAK